MENTTKKELEQLGASLNEKFASLETRVDEINAMAKENGELPEKFEGELKKLAEEQKSTYAEMKDVQVKAQNQIDSMEVKLQRADAAEPKSFRGHVKSLISENKEGLEAVGNSKQSSVQLNLKADMTEAANFSGEVVPADRIPGVFYDPVRPVHVRSFMNVTPCNSDVIRYVKESAYTDGAAATAEGSAAGQTDATFTATDTTIRKINTYLTLSKEMMADADFLENYLRTRVVSKLMAKEDQQLLYGTGVAPQLSGLDGQAASYVDYIADSNVQRIDVITNAVTNTRVNEYSANVALVNPQDYQKLLLTKSSQAEYLVPNVFTGAPLVINGCQVVPNTAVTADDFFVGDLRMGTTMALRSDIEVTFTNSHSDNFTKGFITVLVEERIALVVYRPNAIIYDNFTNALGQGTA